MKILYISPILPYPISSGNRQHINYLLKIVKQFSDIDFVQYGWEDEAHKNKLVLSKMFNSFDVFPSKQKDMKFDGYYGIDDWISDDFCEFVYKKSLNNKYDVVICEYVWMSKALTFFSKNVVKIINTHDVFSDRDKLLEKSGIAKQWYYTRLDQEVEGLNRADILLAITKHDKEFFEKNVSNNVDVLYSFTECENIKLPTKKINFSNLTIGYIGSSNALNIRSINSFLSCLASADDFNSDSIHFNIAGNISNYLDIPEGIRVYKKGYILDEKNFYENIDIVIAPMVEGTGLKIKTVEAMRYGKPLFATKYATNDIESRHLHHKFTSIQLMASYIAKWSSRNISEREKYIDYMRIETQSVLNNFNSIHTSFVQHLKKSIEKKLKNNNITQKKDISVSVIIPFFNTSTYIDRCLRSILKDKLKNIEVICIDDGSTDETLSELHSWSAKDTRIVVLSQDNLGQGVARNKGLDIAQGKYVYFVDSDDYIKLDSLYNMFRLCEDNNLDLCSPNRNYLNKREVEFISSLAGWVMFFKRELIEVAPKIRQPSIRSGQDGVFSNMVLTRVKKVGVCVEADYFYEKREDSTFETVKKSPKIIPILVEQHIKYLKNFYTSSDLMSNQSARYLFFLQDETYHWRLMNNISSLDYWQKLHIFLILKLELLTCLKYINNKERLLFDPFFLNIEKQSFEDFLSNANAK